MNYVTWLALFGATVLATGASIHYRAIAPTGGPGWNKAALITSSLAFACSVVLAIGSLSITIVSEGTEIPQEEIGVAILATLNAIISVALMVRAVTEAFREETGELGAPEMGGSSEQRGPPGSF